VGRLVETVIILLVGRDIVVSQKIGMNLQLHQKIVKVELTVKKKMMVEIYIFLMKQK
jgi:hypothetical protein